MLTGWLSKGLLAFLLTFACAGLAFGQTKSADLPVPQRIQCVPIIIGPPEFGSLPDQMAQSIMDMIQASKAEMVWMELSAVLPWQVGGDTNCVAPPSTYGLFRLASGPPGIWSALLP